MCSIACKSLDSLTQGFDRLLFTFVAFVDTLLNRFNACTGFLLEFIEYALPAFGALATLLLQTIEHFHMQRAAGFVISGHVLTKAVQLNEGRVGIVDSTLQPAQCSLYIGDESALRGFEAFDTLAQGA